MNIFMDLLLGTLAVLAAVVVPWGCFAVMLMGLFVLSQVLFGWGPGEAPSGFAIPQRGQSGIVQRIVYGVAFILAVVAVLLPMIGLLVIYPPARIPFVVLLLMIAVLIGISVLRKKAPGQRLEPQPDPKVADGIKDQYQQFNERYPPIPSLSDPFCRMQ